MSTLMNLPSSQWQTFFDRMSKALLGKRAEIEVASLDIGSQIVVEWIPMIGITYEPRADELDVVLDRMNHVIRHPKEIVVEETADGLASVAVIDGDGARQVVRLKQPVALPPAPES